MYKSEMDRLNKKIDEENISLSAKRALHGLVEDFFSVNYQDISEKFKNKVELNFELSCITSLARCNSRDSAKVREIFSQIKHSLFTILDRSVDRTIKSNLEKILSSLPDIHF